MAQEIIGDDSSDGSSDSSSSMFSPAGLIQKVSQLATAAPAYVAQGTTAAATYVASKGTGAGSPAADTYLNSLNARTVALDNAISSRAPSSSAPTLIQDWQDFYNNAWNPFFSSRTSRGADENIGRAQQFEPQIANFESQLQALSQGLTVNRDAIMSQVSALLQTATGIDQMVQALPKSAGAYDFTAFKQQWAGYFNGTLKPFYSSAQSMDPVAASQQLQTLTPQVSTFGSQAQQYAAYVAAQPAVQQMSVPRPAPPPAPTPAPPPAPRPYVPPTPQPVVGPIYHGDIQPSPPAPAPAGGSNIGLILGALAVVGLGAMVMMKKK